MRTVAARGRRFCVLDDASSLVWAANLSTIELHPYPWRAGVDAAAVLDRLADGAIASPP